MKYINPPTNSAVTPMGTAPLAQNMTATTRIPSMTCAFRAAWRESMVYETPLPSGPAICWPTLYERA
jgi:hypothetical protein